MWSSAGFVQVISGQVTDPDRAKQLMSEMPDMRALRPDIVGTVSVGHEDGKWTMINYFSSEAEAPRVRGRKCRRRWGQHWKRCSR